MKSAVVLAQATKSENVQSFSTDIKREVYTYICVQVLKSSSIGW